MTFPETKKDRSAFVDSVVLVAQCIDMAEQANEALLQQNEEDTPDQTRADNSSHKKPTSGNKGHKTSPAKELPPCFNPRCKGRHCMNECPIFSPEEKKKLLKMFLRK